MDIVKRIFKSDKLNVVFAPPLSLKRNDKFGFAVQYNAKTKQNEYFFVAWGTTETHLITTRTYDKLVDQSDPL